MHTKEHDSATEREKRLQRLQHGRALSRAGGGASAAAEGQTLHDPPPNAQGTAWRRPGGREPGAGRRKRTSCHQVWVSRGRWRVREGRCAALRSVSTLRCALRSARRADPRHVPSQSFFQRQRCQEESQGKSGFPPESGRQREKGGLESIHLLDVRVRKRRPHIPRVGTDLAPLLSSLPRCHCGLLGSTLCCRRFVSVGPMDQPFPGARGPGRPLGRAGAACWSEKPGR